MPKSTLFLGSTQPKLHPSCDDAEHIGQHCWIFRWAVANDGRRAVPGKCAFHRIIGRLQSRCHDLRRLCIVHRYLAWFGNRIGHGSCVLRHVWRKRWLNSRVSAAPSEISETANATCFFAKCELAVRLEIET